MPDQALVPQSENLPIAIPDAVPPVAAQEDGDEFQILARYPYQMKACQQRLIDWATKKLKDVGEEVDDLQENYEIAIRNKWGASTLKRARDRAVKRHEFYEKIKLALEAGYSIVPDFPVDLFAIRRRGKRPSPNTSRYHVAPQESQTLPAGEGQFRSDEVEIWEKTVDYDKELKPIKESFAKYFQDIEFPFVTAKPVILKTVERVMADKFFDEIGALPGSRMRGDPIIIGRIKNPEAGKPALAFLIYWFIDLRNMP